MEILKDRTLNSCWAFCVCVPGFLCSVYLDMKKKKYLPLYYECMETGRLPLRDDLYDPNGLCCVGSVNQKSLKLFTPTSQDEKQLSLEGLCSSWWASGLSVDSSELGWSFTPLRQTIVLFLAAMNDEL